jgi:UDP-glucose 4-epimerase
MLNGKTIMITGGTGSFGKTVATRLLDLNQVREIIIFSRDEKKQHDMRLEYANPKLKFIIGDIRDSESINAATHGVNMIFHAAALKHVPACEFNPMEAVKTNIIGANNVIEAGLRNKVDKVVVLSTDKAAYPVNAMGCSKMMMEKIMVARAQHQRPNDHTIICGVRYGNVLYSRGSVIPLFVEQIKKGKKLTITNENMTRFLLPLPKAVDLVLYALENGQNGDLFIRKSPAATVGNVANACLELFGAKNEIELIGTRAGEKMHETLATWEELLRAEDRGDYYKIPCEREQSFGNYLDRGVTKNNDVVSYTSENTEQLDVDAVKEVLMELPEIAFEVSQWTAK